MHKPKYIDGIKCEYDENFVTVYESYKIDYYDIWDFCYNLRRSLPYVYKRSAHSWVRELVSHKFLYGMHLFRKHTADTTIDENESKLRLVAFYLIYKIFEIYFFFTGG